MSYEKYKAYRLAPDDNGCWDVLDNETYTNQGTFPSRAAAKRYIDSLTTPEQAGTTPSTDLYSDENVGKKRTIIMDLLGLILETPRKESAADLWKLHIDAALDKLDAEVYEPLLTQERNKAWEEATAKFEACLPKKWQKGGVDPLTYVEAYSSHNRAIEQSRANWYKG